MRINISKNKPIIFLFRVCLIIILICFSATLLFAQKNKKIKSIRTIDFRNRTYQVPGEVIKLKNGRYQSKGATYSFESPKYKDFDGDNFDEAVVTLQKKTKGLVGKYRIYLVYTYKNNNLKLVFGQIRPRGDSVKIERGNLVLSGFYWEKNDDDCCPSKKEIETYKWNKKKNKFVLVQPKKIKKV